MKIDFEFDTPHGIFRDALYIPDDRSFTGAEIESMKQQRRDNWIAVVTAPPELVDEETPAVIATDIIEIAGETYQRLEGVPASGAKLIEVNDIWYFKI